MRTWLKLPIITGAVAWALAGAGAGAAIPSEVAAAIQAVRQAPDPSAAVAAYANGMGVDRNNPALYDAYVGRMVELGLPEMAFHQAQALTGMESNNGLAWGVVAYVNARRGEMPEAISAINLAGQLAPTNTFVQRTAGEIIAWYDSKADKSKLPDNLKDGLARARGVLEKQPAFAEAYTTAQNAYKTQAAAPAETGQSPSYAAAPQAQAAPSATQPQGEEVAPLGYSAAAPPPLPYSSGYYPNYYYDWGPSWVQPSPWWWWYPVGGFVGVGFVPFSTVVVFDDHKSFHHRHHPHSFAHNQSFHHNVNHNGLNASFQNPNRAFFHQNGGGSFFGTAARPSALGRLPLVEPTGTSVRSYGRSAASSAPATSPITTMSPAGRNGSATMLAPSPGTGTGSGTVAPTIGRTTAPRTATVTPQQQPSGISSSAAARLRQGTVSGRSSSPSATAPFFTAPRSGAVARSSPQVTAPAVQPRSSFRAAPRFSAPRVAPSSPAMPSGNTFSSGRFQGGGAGGSLRGAPSFSAPRVAPSAPAMSSGRAFGGINGGGFRAAPSFSAPRMAPSAPAMSSGRAFGGGGFHGGLGGGARGGGFGGGARR